MGFGKGAFCGKNLVLPTHLYMGRCDLYVRSLGTYLNEHRDTLKMPAVLMHCLSTAYSTPRLECKTNSCQRGLAFIVGSLTG